VVTRFLKKRLLNLAKELLCLMQFQNSTRIYEIILQKKLNCELCWREEKEKDRLREREREREIKRGWGGGRKEDEEGGERERGSNKKKRSYFILKFVYISNSTILYIFVTLGKAVHLMSCFLLFHVVLGEYFSA